MKKEVWFFSAISCLLLSYFLIEEIKVQIGIFLIIWFIRIYFLKNKTLIAQVFLISFLFIGALFFHKKTAYSQLENTETKLLVYPEPTSINIDGNYLSFKGTTKNISTSANEKIIVQYYLETEADRDLWLKDPPSNYIIMNGDLEKPLENSNFYQFNYQRYLRRKNIYWQFRANDFSQPKTYTLSAPRFSFIDKWRFNIFDYIDRNFNKEPADYIKTLFFGDKKSISEKTLKDYRSLGILHLFSISGFHITFLATKFRHLLLRLGITHESSNLLVILFLPLYGVIAGFGISVFRAVFQAIFLLLGKIFNQTIDTLDAWSLTMILALFINPYQIYDISFQLSYTISGVIILIAQNKWLRELHPVYSSVIFSLISSLASLPILIYHFHEFSWVTIFMNLLFIPFFTYFLFPFLLFLFLFSILFKKIKLFVLLNYFSAIIIRELETLLSTLTKLFNFSIITGHLPAIIMGLLILSIFYIFVSIDQKKKLSIFSIVGLLIPLYYHRLNPVGYVLMLDVGQGDSFIIKKPNSNKITMIDTGGKIEWEQSEAWKQRENNFSIGSDVVVPSLKSFGISKIERLYISHAHQDHMGEITAIAKELPIREVMASRDTLRAHNVIEQLTMIKTNILEVEVPTKVFLPTDDTFILYPDKNYESINNQSLVLYVKIGEDFWMFTGDMEMEAEEDFIKTYPSLQVDYLKVAHHGSKTSSTDCFIQHVNPQHALISVGENNIYNHPSQEVIDRLTKSNIRIKTTAENGAVIVKYFKIPFINHWIVKKETVK